MTTDRRATVVVGIDGSPHSHHVLRWAVRAARLWDADLLAVTAWTPSTVPGWERYDPEVWDPARSAEKAALAVMDEVCGAERPQGFRVVVAEGHPAQVLIERSADADLLVVGDGGRRAVAGAVLGSVSGHCAARAACPTVVVHGEQVPPSAAPQQAHALAHPGPA